MSDKTFVYNGDFPLDWLDDDEYVGAAGDGSGGCRVMWPTGVLHIAVGDWFRRGRNGRFEIVSEDPA